MNIYPVFIKVGHVMRITGGSKRSAQRLLHDIAESLGNKKIKWITVKEFCGYMNIDFQEVEPHFSFPLLKRER